MFYEMHVSQNIQCKQKAHHMKPKKDSKQYISAPHPLLILIKFNTSMDM